MTFFQQANTFNPTIKFTAEISENEIIFLDTVVFKGERCIKNPSWTSKLTTSRPKPFTLLCGKVKVIARKLPHLSRDNYYQQKISRDNLLKKVVGMSSMLWATVRRRFLRVDCVSGRLPIVSYVRRNTVSSNSHSLTMHRSSAVCPT